MQSDQYSLHALWILLDSFLVQEGSEGSERTVQAELNLRWAHVPHGYDFSLCGSYKPFGLDQLFHFWSAYSYSFAVNHSIMLY